MRRGWILLLAAIAGTFLIAALLWPLVVRTRRDADQLTFVSDPFDLDANQSARLQIRHALFCDGAPALRAVLAFASPDGSTAVRNERLECKESTELVLDGPHPGSVARLTLSPADYPLPQPIAELQIISRRPNGEESLTVYSLRREGLP